jgi:hypothetical protein
MAKSKKRPGPKLTDPPHVIAIRARLEKLGHGSLKDAASKAGFSYDGFLRIVRNGLGEKVWSDTVKRLTELGIYDLVVKKHSA